MDQSDGLTLSVMLVFSKAAGARLSLGPFAAVRFEGERLCDGASGSTIAEHLSHGWQVAGADYLRLDIEAPMRVTWDGHAGSPATSGHFSCVNGVAYIDRRILAFVDRERRDWYLLREGHHCPALTVEPL